MDDDRTRRQLSRLPFGAPKIDRVDSKSHHSLAIVLHRPYGFGDHGVYRMTAA